VEALGNIGRLLLNGDKDVAGLVVEALIRAVVANVLDGAADDLLVVDVCLGGDFSEDHNHASLGGSLAGNLGEGVLLEAGIENGVRDLIAAEDVSTRGQLCVSSRLTAMTRPAMRKAVAISQDRGPMGRIAGYAG
jgi:hypothetical protein